MQEEIIKKHRPPTFDKVVGQKEAVKILERKHNTNSIPHAILFHGPFGTGKTTLAKIVGKCLKCSQFDFEERNTADYRGIDSIRDIARGMNRAPTNGDVRIYLLDEAHKITNDAQNAMLKLLEDVPRHVYFLLATTEPEKLLGGIRQRCMDIKLNPVSLKDLASLVKRITKSEQITLSTKVMRKIVEYAGGSAREALQILDKIRSLDTEKEQINAIQKASITTQTIEIARKLIRTDTKWRDIAPILRELENEDPERIRYMILSYGKSVLLKRDNPRAFRMMDAFRDNFYDSKFSGVVAACYEIIVGE